MINCKTAKHYTMTQKPQIIYDGTCKLCNRAVRFLKTGSKTGIVFFPAESPDTENLLLKHHIPRELTGKTVILIEDGKIYLKSSAIIRALQNRGGLWKLAALLRIVPAFIRDIFYNFIARNR
jgi:predicted DCC family thiol-disulfide oxidoreductase YuxK